MEKSRAIELLEHLAWDRDIERNPYGDALNMAIEALKAQLSCEGTTSDLISRQAAIDAIKKHYRSYDNDLLEVIAYEIEHLPSAQPEECLDDGTLVVWTNIDMTKFSRVNVRQMGTHYGDLYYPDED